ncbi:MAG: glycoside hydrolase family 1 protein, partial [Myxococcales bacterium]|nr:glycoside hydrolase family 1 protein [Myxococcales bacterium]
MSTPRPRTSLGAMNRIGTLVVSTTLVVAMLVLIAACDRGIPTAAKNDATSTVDANDAVDPLYDPASVDETWRFPTGFIWGSATAGFQIDMGCPTLSASVCEDPNSDWYAYVTDPATLASSSTHLSGDLPSTGPGFYELYEADLDRVRDELHNNGFRFSFEWSRIFPTATDGVEGYDALREIANPVALEAYHAQLAAMKARGITPLATVIHYTLPLWLHDAVTCHTDFASCTKRGWVDRERAVREAAKYGGFLAREFGEAIDWWVTLNEPYQVMLFGYLLPNAERTNPPALTLKINEAKIVIRGLFDAALRVSKTNKDNDTGEE